MAITESHNPISKHRHRQLTIRGIISPNRNRSPISVLLPEIRDRNIKANPNLNTFVRINSHLTIALEGMAALALQIHSDHEHSNTCSSTLMLFSVGPTPNLIPGRMADHSSSSTPMDLQCEDQSTSQLTIALDKWNT